MKNIIMRPELLSVADSVARDKRIDREEILMIMEQAIGKAGRTRYGNEKDIRASIDRKTGELKLAQYTKIVENVENEVTEISLHSAQEIYKKKPFGSREPEVGDEIIENLPPLDFGRVAAQTAKQIIFERIKEYENRKQYEEYKERIGEIRTGGAYVPPHGGHRAIKVSLDNNTAGILPYRNRIPREIIKDKQSLQVYIQDVTYDAKGTHILLSRTDPGFLKKLFEREVPEIADGKIEIKNAVRDPGSRAKMAVVSHDSAIDPVGSCVGVKGGRVRAIVDELQGERIDIVPWDPEPATFIVNALAPAEVIKVVMDEDNNRVEVIVPDEQSSLAIGKRGQNVSLASKLTGWTIEIRSESDASEKQKEERDKHMNILIESLDVDDVIASLLVSEEIYSHEDILDMGLEEFSEIEELSGELAEEIFERAINYNEKRLNEFKKKCDELKISQELIDLDLLSMDNLLIVAEKGIKTRDDLADLAWDELIEMLGENAMERKEAKSIIMEAREHWMNQEERAALKPSYDKENKE